MILQNRSDLPVVLILQRWSIFKFHPAMRGSVPAFQHLQINRQDSRGFMIASNVANVPTNNESS
jgi:hypothetical protein